MKLRLRYNKTTTPISISEEITKLAQLREIAAQKVSGIGVGFDLSLNGRDKLEGEEKELSDFGIVSGDLIHILCQPEVHENGGGDEAVKHTQKVSHVSSPSVAGGSKSVDSIQKQEVGQGETKMEVGCCNSGTSAAMRQNDLPESDVEVMEEAYKLEQPKSKAERKEISRCLTEPMLCRESTDSAVPNSLVQVYRNSGVNSKTEAMCAVLHVLMLETGFTTKTTKDSKSPKVAESSLSLPEGWRASGSYRLSYEHPACEGCSCNLVIVPLGSQVILHGGVVGGEAQSPVQAQYKLPDYIRDLQPDIAKVYHNLAKLSRLFKDVIALPLLHNIHAAVGSCAQQGFDGLSTEIKLLIMRYLDVANLLRLAEVSKSLNILVKDPWLWRRIYLLQWTKKEDNTLNQNWYELYRNEYKRRKDLRERLRRMTPVLPHHPFFPRPPSFPGVGPAPPYWGGIIGGDHDVWPSFGFVDPLFPGSGRRIQPDQGLNPVEPRFDPIGPDPEIGLPFAAGPAPGRFPRFGGGRHFGGMNPRFM